MKRLISILGLLALTVSVFAQSIKVQAPNVVAADEQFNITFVIEGEDSPSSFSWDEGQDFQLVWGPQKGSSTSITIVNGKRTKSSQYTYTYILLPKKTGTFTISEARATVGGETVTSSRATIEVVSNGSSSRGSSSQSAQPSGSASSSSQGNAASTGEIPRDDLFLRFSLSRTNVVVGEPITATLKLYQRVNIAGFEDARFPTFDGFWSQETYAPSNIDFQRESFNDMIYETAVLRSYVLIPQQAGTLVIDPAELVCLVNVRTSSGRSNSIFDSFFADDYRTIRKRVTSQSATVHVSKLPAGAPASFGGGVGNFSVSSVLSNDKLKTHDAASLVVTISGKGNVSLLEAPKVDFPPDFEVYDVKATESTDASNGRTSGSKTFEYPFIPRSHGKFEIPSIEYSYYDVSAGKYVTLHTGPMTVEVEKGKGTDSSSDGQILQGTVRKDVKSLGSDVRYISVESGGLSRKGVFFVGSAGFWGLLAGLLAAAAAAWCLLRKRAERQADVAGTRNRAATKMAQKRLAVAQGYMKNSLHTAFYEELHRALLGFISDKLNIDPADMSKDNVASALSGAGVGEAPVSELIGLLDACEFARYAPDSGHEAMSAHYDTAVSVISMIDSSMKKKTSTSQLKSTLTLVALLLVPAFSLSAGSQSADSLWKAGVAAYEAGDWDAACRNWLEVEDMGLESPQLYNNIGNSFFKSQDVAMAIVYYSRALKLDPSYSDARFNLEFVSGLAQDRIEKVPEFFLKSWVGKVGCILSSDGWAAAFFILLALALAGAVLFLLSSASGLRRAGFFSGIVCFALAAACLAFSFARKADYFRQDSAVVVTPVVSVKSSPSSGSSKDLFILHEGSQVRVLDAVGGWRNIELPDGRQGWVISSDLEVI